MRNITGTRIKEARQLRGLSQSALAVQLQTRGLPHTRNTIAKIESRYRQITDVELQCLAEILGIPVQWFFEA